MVNFSRLCGILGVSGLIWASQSPLHPEAAQRPWIVLLYFIPAALVVYGLPLTAIGQKIRRILFDTPKIIFNGILLGGTTILFAGYCWYLFQGIPHMDDAVAALFSARLMAAGQLTWPLPQHPEFFKVFGVLSATENRPYLVGMYPPGWSALLALGVLARVPWLINPLLGGALAVAVSELGETLYDRRVGRLAAILLCVSPFVGAVAASHLSHMATALGLVLAWWALVRLCRHGGWRMGLVAGSGLGLALLCRPATAALVAAVMGLGLLPRWRQLMGQWRGLLLAVGIIGLSTSALLGYQHVATGDWRTPGHKIQMGAFAKIGFGEISGRIRHTPQTGAQFTAWRLSALNANLLGWPFISLPLVCIPFVWGRGRWREFWLISPFLVLTLFFAAFWYYEVYYPGRYLFAGIPFLLLPLSWGLVTMVEAWQQSPKIGSRYKHVPEILAAGCILFAISLGSRHYFATITPHHGDVESVLPRVVANYDISNAVVFMNARGTWDRGWNQRNDYYATGFIRNDLNLAGDIIFARDRGPDNIKLMAQYPGRRYLLYHFDRHAHKGLLYETQGPGPERIVYQPVPPRDNWLRYDGKPMEVEFSPPGKSNG